MRLLLTSTALATWLAAASPLAAAEGGPNFELLETDGGTAVWTIIVFVLLLVVLRAAAWKPIQQMLANREKFILDSLETAKKERQEAEAMLAEYKNQLDKARHEASAIVEEGRRDAEVLRRKIEDEARSEAEKMIERSKAEITLATDNAIKELYDVSGRLATDIASRIIRKELNADEHQRLINESIDELGKAIERN